LISKLARNLLANNRWKSALGDEVEKSGPEVSLVVIRLSLSRHREGLAGTGAGGDGTIRGPSSKLKGVGPAANPGEEMALPKRSKVGGSDIRD
jgi:hypothetical protein